MPVTTPSSSPSPRGGQFSLLFLAQGVESRPHLLWRLPAALCPPLAQGTAGPRGTQVADVCLLLPLCVIGQTPLPNGYPESAKDMPLLCPVRLSSLSCLTRALCLSRCPCLHVCLSLCVTLSVSVVSLPSVPVSASSSSSPTPGHHSALPSGRLGHLSPAAASLTWVPGRPKGASRPPALSLSSQPALTCS